MNKNIAVIGAGISGMSTAYLLKDCGYHVTIFAKAFTPNITSDKAAAFWFPYHIRNDKRGIRWCNKSYDFYLRLASDVTTGISMQRLVKALRKGVKEAEQSWIDFMPVGALSKMPESELPEELAVAYYINVPLIETQLFLPYLQEKLTSLGVVFKERKIENMNEITGDYDIVINCAGLGARELCNDNALVPVRGQVALLSPLESLSIYLDNEKPLYVVPRKDAIIVGGTYEEGIETATTDAAAIEGILQTAFKTFPFLKDQAVLGSWAGIRPYRAEVRLEHERGTNIIHNYGHGGSGFTLAFGCAEEVTKIAETIK